MNLRPNDSIRSVALAGSTFARTSSFPRCGLRSFSYVAHSGSCRSIGDIITSLAVESLRRAPVKPLAAWMGLPPVELACSPWEQDDGDGVESLGSKTDPHGLLDSALPTSSTRLGREPFAAPRPGPSIWVGAVSRISLCHRFVLHSLRILQRHLTRHRFPSNGFIQQLWLASIAMFARDCRWFPLLLLVVFTSQDAASAEPVSRTQPVVIQEDQPRRMLGNELEILPDPGRAWTIRDVVSPELASRFVPVTSTSPVFGFTQDAYWVRFRLKSSSSEELHPVVQLETSRFSELHWFGVCKEGDVATPSGSEPETSRLRFIQARLPAIVLDMDPQEELWVYLRAWTPGSSFFPIFVYPSSVSYARDVVIGEALWLPFLGLVGAVGLLSVYFGYLFQQRLFYVNALMICLYCLFLAIHSGYWEWLGWIGSPGIKWQPLLCVSQLNSLTTLWFNFEYFRLKPFGHRTRLVLYLSLTMILALLWLPYPWGIHLTHWLSLGTYCFCFGIAVRRAVFSGAGERGWVGVLLIALAWLTDAVVNLLVILQWHGWIPMLLSPPTALLIPAGVSPLLVLAAVADRFYQLMQNRMRMHSLEQSLSEARFRALRYQMNPHFLYNALNSVRGLLLENPAKVEDFVTRLARFLRSSLTLAPDLLVPLYRELETLSNYLDVEKVRFENRLDVDLQVPAPLESALVPELILQPLVENAIKYGAVDDTGCLTIRIRITSLEQCLTLEVSNSGRLYPNVESKLETSRVGLENLRRRLELVFPGRSSLLLSEEGGRVTARVSIPLAISADTDSQLSVAPLEVG